MANNSGLKILMMTIVGALLVSEFGMIMVQGRYLPTRSQDDRIQRLRELLKDLLESQSYNNNNMKDSNYDQATMEMLGIGSPSSSVPGHSPVFKRDVSSSSLSGFGAWRPLEKQITETMVQREGKIPY